MPRILALPARRFNERLGAQSTPELGALEISAPRTTMEVSAYKVLTAPPRAMNAPRIKICGITCIEDALLATELGAHALGFIFAESPRWISPDAAAEIIRRLPLFVSPVGVFVNESTDMIQRVVEQCGLAAVQLHGDETPDEARALAGVEAIKAIRVKDASSLDGLDQWSVSAFLLDTYSKEARGGTGRTFDWDLAREARLPAPMILAGGLDPANVREAIETVRPYGVDISSGVESEPGKKDHALLKQLFEQIAEATR